MSPTRSWFTRATPQPFGRPRRSTPFVPRGKAPVIEDGALVLAESCAVIEYLIATYGRGKPAPAAGGAEWAR